MNTQCKTILASLSNRYPGVAKFKRKEIHEIANLHGYTSRDYAELIGDNYKISRGLYDLSGVLGNATPTPVAVPAAATTTMKLAAQVSSTINEDAYVPSKDPTYVKWGSFEDILEIIRSNTFYPIYIAGLSGNGKTMMVEQACAQAGREYIRVQISPETDEDDLIGGFRLLNGETVFAKGPVIKAMERGAILLIDEIDRATNKIMCLQGVLEGKPVLIKKTGELIHPSPGFNVLATANTKGKGSDDGRFVAAAVIDEAFLERFVATIEQPYPPLTTERKIVVRHMEKFGKIDEEFAERLCTWSEVIRKTFEDDGVDEVISTRRLCHIAQTFSIFNDRLKAVQMCISRFDTDTKTAFLDLYTKIDASVQPKVDPVTPANSAAETASSTF
jgi:MoxR-like ATPase